MASLTGMHGKVIFTANLKLLSGLHIGSGNDFSAIGAVDSTTARDPLTRQPYIPGSSLKGKMRYLLACYLADTGALCEISDEPMEIKRLFGNNKGIKSRLQFFDVHMNAQSKERMKDLDTDLYLTEIKFENTISRLQSKATPRQIERVLAGSEFDFKLVYNIENLDELEQDMEYIYKLIQLLEDDYLGGHGTRGYGRVQFENVKAKYREYGHVEDADIIQEIIRDYFDCQ